MTTSEPSQARLFDLGSEEHTPKLGPLWPTPAAHDDNKSPEAHMAMKARMPGGPRQTVTSLQVAVKAGIEPAKLFDLGSQEQNTMFWPTPRAQEDGRTPEQWEEARLRHYETRKETGTPGGPAGAKGSLAVCVQRMSISSPPAIPANRSVMPGSDWARRMTVISGQKLHAYLPSSDRVSSSVRTLLATSVWASTTCYLTWKRSATPHGRLLFRLVPSTRLTAAIGFGLWPTPTGNPNDDRRSKPIPAEIEGRHGWSLTSAMMDSLSENPHRLWPTPRYSPSEDRTYKVTPSSAAGKHGKHLQAQVLQAEAEKLLPTPMPSDVMGGRTTKGKDWQDENGLRLPVGGKLSAAWVTALMGYPSGYLDLD